MITQILSTGDEILYGQICDTNAAFLASRLTMMGIRPCRIQAAGDDKEPLVELLSQMAAESDLVLVTGGLGPTNDDRTALAASLAFNLPLELNPEALESMTAYFKKRGFELTKANEKQAWLPRTAKVLVNENGTAPGFCVQSNKCRFFFMPGVPSEMKQMFFGQVQPVIAAKQGMQGRIHMARVSVFGLPESRVGELLKGFDERFENMRLGFRANFPVIEVKIVCHEDESKPESLGKDIEKNVDQARQWVISKLENRVYSDTGLSLAAELGRELSGRNLTLAVAESCTGGLIASSITDVSGSSGYFLMAAVTYANAVKTGCLGVEDKTLQDKGAVDEAVALQMARGVRTKSGAHVALSTTGIAGPGGATDTKPVGMVCVAAVGPGFSVTRTYYLDTGDRLRTKALFAAAAMNLLLRQIKKLE